MSERLSRKVDARAVGDATDARERLDPTALALYFKALAHEKRVRLLNFLVEPRSLEEIASELSVARQTAHEHLQTLLEVGLVERVEGRADGTPGMGFVAVQHRLFLVYEMVGRLGDLEPRLEEKAAVRAPTVADASPAGSLGDRDLPRLTVVHGLRVGHTKVLAGEGPWSIGRDPHAALRLDFDPYVSARHAEVRRVAGGFEVTDLYASNGTYLDWKPLERGSSKRLPNGAILRVGRTLLSFRQPALDAK